MGRNRNILAHTGALLNKKFTFMLGQLVDFPPYVMNNLTLINSMIHGSMKSADGRGMPQQSCE